MAYCDHNKMLPHSRRLLVLVCVVATLATIPTAFGQLPNRAPFFMPGSGDMARFSLPENTPVGSTVYQLKGVWLIRH